MKKFFEVEKIESLQDLKNQYKDLIKKYHPDVNSNGLEAMKAINAEYEQLFKEIKNNTLNKEETKHHDINDNFRTIIEKIIFLDDIKIEIIGSWVWISGNTYQHYNTIKEAGFKFSKSKKAWYWYNGMDSDFKKHFKGRYSMNELRLRHGYATVEKEEQKKLSKTA